MITKQHQKTKRGFTIIEVVLVLAIAGLIFLMVFIALPALQRSQRDTQRRDDMARFIAQLSQYQANNKGKVPGASASAYTTFINNYLKAGGDTFDDPSSGKAYVIKGVTNCTSAATCTQKSGTSSDTEVGNIFVYANATCNGEAPSYTKGANKIAVTIKLEGAGVYCGHN